MIAFDAAMALAALLFVKHAIADGPLQTDYQARNKGRFLHPGGMIHAGWHASLTIAAFVIWAAFVPEVRADAAMFALVVGGLAAAEFVTHYLIDLGKMRICAPFQWSRVVEADDGRSVLQVENSAFFIAFVIDQALHYLTYLAMIRLALGAFGGPVGA